MKVLVIPDVHLKPWVFREAAASMRSYVVDKAVCLMDIPDDWDREFDLELYEDTFDAAIEFAVAFPETLWCWGNHDLSYVWGMRETGYSWFARGTVSRKLLELEQSLPDPAQLAYLHRIDNVLFCHGGLSEYFVKTRVDKARHGDIDAVVSAINALDCEDMWNDLSPIWFRPQYKKNPGLYESEKYLQVVGHTPVEDITIEGSLLSCDVFSTYRDGNPIGSQRFPVLDTNTLILYN